MSESKEGFVDSLKTPALPTSFFLVEVEGDTLGCFMNVSGLEMSYNMETYEEGGRNTGPLYFPGRVNQQTLTLERGVVKKEFYTAWMKQALTGVYKRLSGTVTLCSPEGKKLHKWSFTNAYPTDIASPDLNSMRSDIAVLRISLAYNGTLIEDV